MKTIPLRDLRTRPQEAQVREETLLTASNGRPVAVLLPVDAGTVDETIQSSIAHPETAALLRALMTEAGLPVPPEGHPLDSVCVTAVCQS